ncbi:MAG: hypothetical protein AB7V40_04260 [Methyloceanibacter sp.]
MVSIRSRLARLILAAMLIAPRLALAGPAEPAPEESADATFAKSFLGKAYDDELEIEGWIDLGGGLVAPPIYVHQYLREEDGTYLVLTSREVAKAGADTPASFVVLDALIVPAPQKDAAFSLACVQGDDATLKFMGEAKGNEDKEWWSDVRRAWEISLETGAIVSIPSKGVRCTNPGW